MRPILTILSLRHAVIVPKPSSRYSLVAAPTSVGFHQSAPSAPYTLIVVNYKISPSVLLPSKASSSASLDTKRFSGTSSPMANLSLSLVIISPSIHSYSLSSLNLLLRPIGKPSTISQTQLLKEQCCTNHLPLLPRILCQTTLPTNLISILTLTPLRTQNLLTSTILLPTNHRPTTIRPIMTQPLFTLRRSLLQI